MFHFCRISAILQIRGDFMKFKRKLFATVSAALAVAVLPVNALAAVRVDIYGDRRVYGTQTPFDTYIEL